MTDDTTMSAAADIARHAAREGLLPEGYRRPNDPTVARMYEAVFLLAGNALVELDRVHGPADTSPAAMVSTQLVAITLSEAYALRDLARAHEVMPTTMAELTATVATLAATVAQLTKAAHPSRETEAYAELRRLVIDHCGTGPNDHGHVE
ncbi:MAG: hypothetical protein WBA72_10625 [Ornithinimicrobium sp.]